MKRLIAFASIFTVALLLKTVGAEDTDMPHADDIAADDISWLTGCWESADASAQEVWVEDSDGSLLGFGVALNEGRIGFYEVLRISEVDGVLTYTPFPFGGPPTAFTVTTLTERQVTFIAPEHDYPQQIDYRLMDGVLRATISELEGRSPRSFDKQRCE
jgi:Domain of unknown function (DUF6265)